MFWEREYRHAAFETEKKILGGGIRCFGSSCVVWCLWCLW